MTSSDRTLGHICSVRLPVEMLHIHSHTKEPVSAETGIMLGFLGDKCANDVSASEAHSQRITAEALNSGLNLRHNPSSGLTSDLALV
ncbi:Hypothetical protein NTJ_01206 [Nesidiocoris tenuis]|uniref:Uncharacterized protein n=1 Tax=Nesidiocoris tenuis TaxID=355587 RepID=A0ABN7A895_9HEMI|nr:Hypothetical protein NTJ_01206 [Nesidiocoris tenuis]